MPKQTKATEPEEIEFDTEAAEKSLAESKEKLADIQAEIDAKQEEIAANVAPVKVATLADCVKQFQDAAKKSIAEKAKVGTIGKRK